MELVKGKDNNMLIVSRKEMKHYLDNATEAFLEGKTRIMFPTECNGIDTVMVRLE